MRSRPRPVKPETSDIGNARSTRRQERQLTESLELGWANAARKAGEWLACRPGCSDCCHGPFPITRLDARWLAQGLSELRRSDPVRAAAVETRARQAAAVLEDGFPGDPTRGRLAADTSELDRFFGRHTALPCPVIDPHSGRCELYDSRPVACRTYGPPLRYGAEKANPCPLCFRDAPADTVERCRWAPDPGGLEPSLLARLGVAGGGEWETLIAHALVLV